VTAAWTGLAAVVRSIFTVSRRGRRCRGGDPGCVSRGAVPDARLDLVRRRIRARRRIHERDHLLGWDDQRSRLSVEAVAGPSDAVRFQSVPDAGGRGGVASLPAGSALTDPAVSTRAAGSPVPGCEGALWSAAERVRDPGRSGRPTADPSPVRSPGTARSEAGFQVTPTILGREGRPPLGRVDARVLGCPAVLGRDGAPVGSVREAALELLVYLAVHRDGVSIDAVKEAVYGDATRTRAAQRLSTDVANLRNRIRHAAGVGQGVNPVVNTGGRYRLDPSLVEVDWWTVQAAARRVREAGDDHARVEALRTGLAAFHGVLAAGADYEWLSEYQESSRRLGVGLHLRLAVLLWDRDPREAARLLEGACDLDPYDEDLAVRAMRAHARLSDGDAIRGRWRRLRAGLSELGESPDPATEDLVATLLTGRSPIPAALVPSSRPYRAGLRTGGR
jgi:DNA-binding SARP family transcriptional activator